MCSLLLSRADSCSSRVNTNFKTLTNPFQVILNGSPPPAPPIKTSESVFYC